MPANLDDYSKDDPDAANLDGSTGGGGAPAGGTAGGGGQGPRVEQASNQEQQPYIPWSSFVSANQGVSDREAGKLQGQVQGDVNAAQSGTTNANKSNTDALNSNYGIGPTTLMSPPMQTAQAFQPAPNQQAQVQGSRAVAGGAPPPSNPWASFLPDAKSPGNAAAAASPLAQQAAAGRASTAAAQNAYAADHNAGGKLKPNAASTSPLTPALQGISRQNQLEPGLVNPRGSDLESSLGPDAWSALLGKTQKAGDEASKLGSPAGIQALLKQNDGALPDSAFDAALIGGAGQKGFQQLNQQYGKGQLTNTLANDQQASQDRWTQLQGDVNAKNANLAASQAAGAAAGTRSTEPTADPSQAAANSVPVAPIENGPGPFSTISSLTPQQTNDILSSIGLYHGGNGGKLQAQADAQMLNQLGLTGADYAALEGMTDDQRTAWLAQRKKDKGIA